MEVNETISREPEVINLDLESIRRKAEHSFRLLVRERPEKLPWSVFTAELGKTESVCAPVTKMLFEKVPDLVKIQAIYAPTFFNKIEPWEREVVLVAAKGLSELGIAVSEESLIASLEEDMIFKDVRQKFFKKPISGLMEIAACIQEEYARTVFAARTYETARIIMNIYAPAVLWPKRDSIYYFHGSATDRDYSGSHGPDKKGRHWLKVMGRFGDLGLRLKEINSSQAGCRGYYHDMTVTAIHEAGHAVFDELFGLKIITEAQLLRSKDQADVFRALTEGFAIMYEKLGVEILGKMVPVLPDYFHYGPQAVSDRYEFFKKNGKDPLGRAYLDGYIMMRRLASQLKASGLPRQEQIRQVTDFLRKIDIKKAATIKHTDEGYTAIINDPLNKLPRC